MVRQTHQCGLRIIFFIFYDFVIICPNFFNFQTSDVNLSFKMPSPLGQLQQLTISDHSSDERNMSTDIMSTNIMSTTTHMSSTMNDDDDVEMTRQKILADILSDDEKNIPENFETILNPIYFDFSS